MKKQVFVLLLTITASLVASTNNSFTGNRLHSRPIFFSTSKTSRDEIRKLIADIEQAKASLNDNAPGTVKQKIVQFLRNSATVIPGVAKGFLFTSAGAVTGAVAGPVIGATTAFFISVDPEENETRAKKALSVIAFPGFMASALAAGAVAGPVVGAVKGGEVAVGETLNELRDIRLKASLTQSLKSTVDALIDAQTELLNSMLSDADTQGVKAAVDIPALQSLVTKIGTIQSLTKPADLLREAVRLGVKFSASLPASQAKLGQKMWDGINKALDKSVQDSKEATKHDLRLFKLHVVVDLFLQGDITGDELDSIKANFALSENVVAAAKAKKQAENTKNERSMLSHNKSPNKPLASGDAEMKRKFDQAGIVKRKKSNRQEALEVFISSPLPEKPEKPVIINDTYSGNTIKFTRPISHKTQPYPSGSDGKTKMLKNLFLGKKYN